MHAFGSGCQICMAYILPTESSQQPYLYFKHTSMASYEGKRMIGCDLL